MRPASACCLIVIALTTFGCSEGGGRADAVETEQRLAAGKAEGGAPLFGDLGDYHYPVTTRSEQAQRYFDQGLILTYAFNHPEAVRSFQEAARLDPTCAMAWWGVALNYGPNINKPMAKEDVAKAWEALQKAQGLSKQASEKERAMTEALAKRKSPQEALDSAAAEWDKITDRRGRDKQTALWGEKMSEMKQVGIEYHPDWAKKAK
jgi:tetratricopeptide (TPR) repeat protein